MAKIKFLTDKSKYKIGCGATELSEVAGGFANGSDTLENSFLIKT